MTWKNPTNALVTNIIQKFLVKANTPTNSPLRTADVTKVFFASILANNTGLIMLPITLPIYFPDYSNPMSDSVILRSFLIASLDTAKIPVSIWQTM